MVKFSMRILLSRFSIYSLQAKYDGFHISSRFVCMLHIVYNMLWGIMLESFV